MGLPRTSIVRVIERIQRQQQRAEAARSIIAEEAAKRLRLAVRAKMVADFPDPSEPKRNCDPSDRRAGYPLGILYLRGDITEEQYEAGLNYTRLHYAIFGASSTHSALAAVTPPGNSVDADDLIQSVPLSDEQREERMARIEYQLSEATAALLALPTLHPYSTLCNLVLYDRPLRFMDTSRRRTPEESDADARDLEALKLALDTLVSLG